MLHFTASHNEHADSHVQKIQRFDSKI